MTKEEQEIYLAAENGVLNAVYNMRKSLNMIESWILYGRMEKSKQGKSAIITEEQNSLDNEIVTRHPITGEKI